MNKIPALDNVQEVEEAIEAARQYAQKNGAPLTLARLACTLGMDMRALRRLTLSEDEAGSTTRSKAASGTSKAVRHRRVQSKISPEVRRLLRRACDEAGASVIEFGMRKGFNPTMAMFLCRTDHGFSEEPTQEHDTEPVIFIGEDEV